jgi:hypothetical protein
MTERYLTIARAAGVEEGLAARLADPLWMLARQWQFGEFRGDDAGSAVLVTAEGAAHHPSWWRPEPDANNPSALPWRPWTVLDGPLEPVIEAEPDTGASWLRLRLDGGVRARRALLAAGLSRYAAALFTLARWPNRPDDAPPVTAPADIMAMATTPDGAALAALITPWKSPGDPLPNAIAATLGGTAAERDAFADAMRDWLTWWTPRADATQQPLAGVNADPPAWDAHRLEHRGSIAFAAAPHLRLHIDRYPGGGLDWFGADAKVGDPAELPAAPAPPVEVTEPAIISETSVPLPTTFAGMAAPRFWEFEDASVDFGSIDASPADLARVLLVEFSTVYGNDWFSLPVRLPVGSLARIDTVRVTDSFGGVQELKPLASSSPGWRLYSLRAPDSDPDLAINYFWCAPTLSERLTSPEVERVIARRDEIANTAWATVEIAADALARGYEVPADKAELPSVSQPPYYLVETPVADNWFPLAPKPVDIASIRLELVALVRRAQGQIVEAHPPSAILAGNWWIHEEELGRDGLTLDRTAKLARWHDGTATRWIGRGVWPGAGEASSNLLWDAVVE